MNLLLGSLTIGFFLSLLTLGVYLSFRIYHFPDITADGSFPLGAAVAAVLIAAGVHPALATLSGFGAGLVAGFATGVLHTRFRIHPLLSGILVMTALYSINLHIMGRSNVPILGNFTLINLAEKAWLQAAGRPAWQFLGWEIGARDLAALGLALMTQSWRLQLDRWPQKPVVELPIGPLQSVDEVRVISSSGQASVVAANQYLVDVASKPPRLVLRGPLPLPGRPAAGIEIDFTAGFGDAAADVPAPIHQALLLLVAHWHEHRDPIEIGSAEMTIPAAVSSLLLPFKVVRL